MAETGGGTSLSPKNYQKQILTPIIDIMKNKYFLEALGTMVLVLMGCGAAVMNGGASTVATVLTIAFAFGLSVVAMAYAIGPVTGCHINPAITLGVWLSGRMKTGEALGYMAAQVVGGIVGSAILYALTHSGNTVIEATGANSFAEGQLVPALIAEIVFTFIFVFVVLRSTAQKNGAGNFAGLAIGLTLVLVHIVCIPVTGTSVNPARSIGPALYRSSPDRRRTGCPGRQGIASRPSPDPKAAAFRVRNAAAFGSGEGKTQTVTTIYNATGNPHTAR